MKQFSLIAQLPEATGAVMSEPSGALLDCAGAIDAEAAGAVNAFCVQVFGKAGESLGLGSFQHAAIVGDHTACALSAPEGVVLGVYFDPARPAALIEKKIQDIVQRRVKP